MIFFPVRSACTSLSVIQWCPRCFTFYFSRGSGESRSVPSAALLTIRLESRRMKTHLIWFESGTHSANQDRIKVLCFDTTSTTQAEHVKTRKRFYTMTSNMTFLGKSKVNQFDVLSQALNTIQPICVFLSQKRCVFLKRYLDNHL